MKRIRIHIDRLTLDGFDGIDGRAVGAAVERELARMVAREPPRQSSTRDRADAGALAVPPRPTAGQLGHAVSSSLHRAIRRGGTR